MYPDKLDGRITTSFYDQKATGWPYEQPGPSSLRGYDERIVKWHVGRPIGVHFLADAVDPMAFMAELRKAGVEQVENFEQVNCPKDG